MSLLDLPGICLQDLSAASSLQARQDRKYVIATDVLTRLVNALTGHVAVLEVDGLRSSRYETRYYDTGDLLTARHHAQGVRRRFKARTRSYLDSGLVRLELKGKGGGGHTVKYALDGAATELDSTGRGFLRDALDRCYGPRYLPDVVDRLRPTVDMTCRRTTLVGTTEQLRVTVDRDLRFGGARLRPDLAVLEVKSVGPRTDVDRLLVGLGARPVSFSKYVAAIELTRGAEALRRHPAALLRRWFGAEQDGCDQALAEAV
jgi:hypothetical protein